MPKPWKSLVAAGVASPLLIRAILALWRTTRKSRKEHSLDLRPFSSFLQDIKAGRLSEVFIASDYFEAVSKDSKKYRTNLIPDFERSTLVELLSAHGITFSAKLPPHAWLHRLQSTLLLMLPFVYLALVWRVVKAMRDPPDSVGRMIRGKRRGEMGIEDGGMEGSLGFHDVAGVDIVKENLADIVTFLKDASAYRDIGARLPRGLLLSGPPGTGKTLLARALSNEAGVRFFSVTGSEFVESLVGRGAARVRDLFRRARDSAPAIIFVDELDALAKMRGGVNSNDEREQTLNQLLTEMDGFDMSDDNPVLVIGATNRAEVIDAALLRRFDRHEIISLPDQSAREAILEVHLRKVRRGAGIDSRRIAAQTCNLSGAHLATIVNEAALVAVRENSQEVTGAHIGAVLKRYGRQ
uniref:AAA+ ATPase domain-containing protein n=1 Tax=Octactis speculum TaxID=3111310 RepID=A0A7S2CSP7_9STRA|mmetsp:Transcript_39595/g.53817  ORF Transcript_39595/g.53817 Transcript_39595/m.53817 type:complete len:410 (+) Transcript_39595:101-1330(+)